MKTIQILLNLYLIQNILTESCNSYNDEYNCNGDSTDWDNRCFQTPPRGSQDYKETYQDMNYLVGYAQLKYSSNKTYCNITFITRINEEKLSQLNINYNILYKFGEIEQELNYITLNSEDNKIPNGLSISAKIIDIDNDITLATLQLEEEYLIWDIPEIIQKEEIYENGQKGSIVELFGWPFDDIAEECDILKVAGYLGIKITPPNEHVFTKNWIESDGLNPWEYFIQPVSYKLNSRLGNKTQLKSMINKCRKNNIRIYSQIVINQMTYNGNDIYEEHYEERDCSPNNKWTAKSSNAGSPFFTILGRKDLNKYTGRIPIFEFPSVPYCGTDIHCKKGYQYSNYPEYDSSWINGLIDLNTGKPYVQQRIADFLTELISIGISGFSIYNGKYISTTDYCGIFGKFKENLGDEYLPKDFFAILEMSFESNDEINYFICNNNIDESFGSNFDEKLRGVLSGDDYKKIKIQTKNIITCDSSPIINEDKYISVFENEKNQLNDENNINTLIQNVEGHKSNYINMFQNTNSKIKIVFSSYTITNGGTGFPDGYSDCTGIEGCIKSVPYSKAYDPLSTGYDTENEGNNLQGVYTRVHRDLLIINAMRESMNLTQLSEDELYRDERAKIYGCPTTIPTTIITTTNPTTIITSTIPKLDSTNIIPTSILTTIIQNKDLTNIPISDINSKETNESALSSEINDKNSNSLDKCTAQDYFNKICKLNNNTNYIYINSFIKNIETEIIDGNMNDLLENVINEIKKDLIIEEKNCFVEITSSYNQNNKKYSNISTIQLGDCENILKDKYNISEEQTLIILKIDYYEEGSLTPIVEYEIFHPITKEALNLEYCNETKINLLIPATIDESNLLKYNSSSEYYTNKCYPTTSANSTDITLDDRKNEYINNNLSLCESNCDYNGYDIKNKKVLCECEVKDKFDFISDISIDKTKLLEKFKNFSENLNLHVVLCYYIFFTKEGFTKNIGNFILLSIIMYNFLAINLFVMKGYEIFKKKNSFLIDIIMKKIKQNNEKEINENNEDKITDKNSAKNKNKKKKILNTQINELKSLNKEYENSKKNLINANILKVPPKKKIKIIVKKKKKIGSSNSLILNIFNATRTNNPLIFSKSFKNINFNQKFSKNDVVNNSSKDIIIKNSDNKIIDNMNNYNDYELNNLPFKSALEIDKRTYCQYYISLLKTKHILVFTFYNYNDYNSILLKTCIFLFSFSLYFTINTLFYTDSTMHKIYEDEGRDYLIYRLPRILYSTIISISFNYLIKYLSLSQKNLLQLKNAENVENLNTKIKDTYRCLNIKFTLFFNISLLFLIFFWYYVSCFCAVYKNTQTYLIKDTLISFALSLVYPIIINTLPGLLRIQSLRESYSNRECMYKFSKLIQLI